MAPSILWKKLVFFAELELLALLIDCVLSDWSPGPGGKLLPPGLEDCTVRPHPAPRRAFFTQKWSGCISKEFMTCPSCKEQVICKNIFSVQICIWKWWLQIKTFMDAISRFHSFLWAVAREMAVACDFCASWGCSCFSSFYLLLQCRTLPFSLGSVSADRSTSASVHIWTRLPSHLCTALVWNFVRFLFFFGCLAQVWDEWLSALRVFKWLANAKFYPEYITD